ncbi:pVSP [Giardia muris]|uniref:PVSP n=1 Tax=Giardia muris TaxID=5742 RepID=A0A4Z1SQD4_GIAMU|nr:pVSP [Giardia muris]TNJ28025.1 pVSP [Giardia muris]TNJ28026.1 pVSP [Giardia muris]|eukprot:TNJ26695.1 pVSP [Giardia muris]
MVKGGGKARAAPAPAACSPAITNCGTDKCLKFGSTQVCTECDAGNVPINGNCASKDDSSVTAAGCTKADGSALDDTSQTCGKCGNAFVLFQGGCYAKDPATSLICATTSTDAGKCGTCKDGLIPNTAASATTDACDLCDSTCKTCSEKESETKCETCYEGYYFDSNTKTCTACPTNCATCTNANTCQTCKAGYLLGTGKCDACASGYLPDANNANCFSCSVENCVQASAANTCSKCGPAFFLSGSGTSATCGTCPTGCDQCDTDTNHQNCDTDKCSEGFFYTANSDTTKNYGTCTKCTVENCKTCSSTACTACKEGFGLVGDTAKTCTACSIKNCGICNDDVTKCTGCKAGFGPVKNGSAITACNQCSTGCESCLNLGLGLVCDVCSNSSQVPVDDECVDVNAKVCTKDPSSGSCASCLNGYMFYHGACLSPYKASSMGICSKDNQFLVGEALVCKECKAGFVPIDGTCTPIGDINKGTTRAAGDNVCMKADGTPIDAKATKCEACKDTNSNYFFNGGCYPTTLTSGTSVGSKLCQTADADGKCSQAAQNTPFPFDTNTGAFTLCPAGCGTCTSNNHALTCTGCSIGYYNSASGGTFNCTACPSGCTVCTKDACTTCWNGNSPDTNGKCPSPPSSSSSGLSGGAIAGIVIAVLLVLGGLGGFLGWWFGCRGK